VVIYLACFAAMREVATTHPGSEWALLAIPVAFGCVEAVYGIAQHAIRGEDNYAVGTFADHSHFAGFMELLLPLTLVYGLRYRHLLMLAPPLIVFAALLHSFSRAGLAASALAIVAMVAIHTRKFKMAGFATAIMLLAVLLLAPSGLGERFQRISSFDGFQHDAHLARWQDTLRLIAARPLFGSGAGTYPVAFAPYNTSTTARYAHHADNDYLQLLAEIGIAGTLATLALLAFALYCSVRASRWNLAALGCAGAMIALLAHSVFEFQLYIPANVLTLAWIAGVGSGVSLKPFSK
jgi:O-antigen ligase